MDKLNRFVTIAKSTVNADGTIDVFGKASTEQVDADGEIVTKEAMTDAIPGFFKLGTGALRAMHQPIAAGFVYKAEVNAAGETEIAATVVDLNEVRKVQMGVYKGFSIGGKTLPGGYDKVTKKITKMKLTEISLVDSPSNPSATIEMWKGEDLTPPAPEGKKPEEQEIKKVETPVPETVVDIKVDKTAVEQISKLADMIDKGTTTPARILELIEADKKPAPEEVKKPEEIKKVATGEDIKKGMYSIRSLADVLNNIQWLTSDAAWEASAEKDNSALPGKLRDWLKTGAELLLAMTKEECDEMIASLNSQIGDVVDVEVIALNEKIEDIKKSFTAEGMNLFGAMEIAKANGIEEADVVIAIAKGDKPVVQIESLVVEKIGAKHSKDTRSKIQTMHDHSVELGAACALAKAEVVTGIVKICSGFGMAEGEEYGAFIEKVAKQRDELVEKVKKLEAMPAPSKIALRVVAKSDDVVLDGSEKEKVEDPNAPILKADGTVDHEATAKQQIMKVHASGGRVMIKRGLT